MVRTVIPVSEFLYRAMHASVPDASGSSDYAAMLVVAARTSDAEGLHADLYKHWSSLDDLTNGVMLIIAPQDRPPGEVGGVRFGGGEYVVARDLQLAKRPGVVWRGRFADILPLETGSVTTAELGPWKHAPRRPESAEEVEVALTQSVTEIRRFFGLSSADLPCLVLVSLWDRHVFVVPTDRSFAIVTFLRAVMAEFEPASDRIAEALGRVARADDERRPFERHEKRLAELDEQRARVMRRWASQRHRVKHELAAAAGELPEIASDVSALIEVIDDGGIPAAEHQRSVDRVLAAVQESRFGYTLGRELPKVVRKLRDRYPQAPLLQLDREAARFDVHEKEPPARPSVYHDLAAARSKAHFSDCFLTAAEGVGLRVCKTDKAWRDDPWTWCYMERVTSAARPATVRK